MLYEGKILKTIQNQKQTIIFFFFIHDNHTIAYKLFLEMHSFWKILLKFQKPIFPFIW